MQKREYARKDFLARVNLEFTGDAGATERTIGLIEDETTAGLLISLKREVEPGSALKICTGLDTVDGIVRSCDRTDHGFQIRVQPAEFA